MYKREEKRIIRLSYSTLFIKLKLIYYCTMIQNRIYCCFSSIRIFSNIFTVTNDQYTLSADITPPTNYAD